MRKIFVMAAIPLLLGFAVLISRSVVDADTDRGRLIVDEYGTRNASRDQVKFHLALQLVIGRWTDVQKQLILRSVNAPSKELEAEISGAFSREQAVDVFYKIGSVDIADLRSIYALPIGKSEIAHGWTVERQTRLWQMNFALGFVRYELGPEQQRYLVELAAALPLTREQSVAWDERAARLFTRDQGRGLFATIGEARCPGQLAAAGRALVLPQCVCTTNSGNWSCNDTCHSPGTCNVDPGNCGFLWLWDCNGMCDNSSGN